MSDGEFPEAKVVLAKGRWPKQWSRMWLVTLVCVLGAIALVWYARESPGPEIVIRFNEGHGLKSGDALRHRGIEIGRVESVRLSETLEGISVTATLDADAAAIACQGSRFWVVRPQLDLTGISGLETAVGAKYIAVDPGNTTIEQIEFDGLGTPPPDGLGGGGIEIIVRGDERYGVNPGSPVTWRGVQVGQVLSSSLSPDALHVDTRIRIEDSHRRLLSRDSKFWVTSGIHMGLDVGGFEFSAESLAEIARGGIAFITPVSERERLPVRPGDVFTLHKEKNDRWFDSVAALNLMTMPPPPMAFVTATWRQSYFGIPRSHESHASALTVETAKGASVLIPADPAHIHASAVEGTYQLDYTWDGQNVALSPLPAADDPPSVKALAVPPGIINPSAFLDQSRIRLPTETEDCFAIRRSWHSDRDSAVVIEMIGKNQLVADEQQWRCSNEKLSRDVWHGAAVVASIDEKVIGMVVVIDHEPMVLPLPTSLVQ